MTRLIRPDRAALPGYLEALERGWGPDNLDPEGSSARERAAIAADPDAFLAALHDQEARGGPIRQPDGSFQPRLPGYRRWIWADGFCGSIGLRWRPGTAELPPHVLGHVGYAIVPWRRGEGHATAALRLLLPEARALGLPWIELTTQPDNIPSQRVIEANGGVLVERFEKAASLGGGETLRWRIALA